MDLFQIMHQNTVVAKANTENITEILIPELCPKCFVIGMPLDYWMQSRSVDTHRSHSRQLFHALRLNENNDIEKIIAIGHGITITDNWWIQKEYEHLEIATLRQYNERLADIAFYGSSSSEQQLNLGYTELGTTGSYEKAWRFANGSWYMYKHGNIAELLSEFYATKFLEALEVPVAEYHIQHHKTSLGLEMTYMITKDFTDNAKVDFEPFCNYFGEETEPDIIIPKLGNPQIKKQYVLMTFYDALLKNVDRHNQNVGFLRNAETGKIIGLSPLFDYNLSLVSAVPYHTQASFSFDSEKGSDLVPFFLQSEQSLEIIKDCMPYRAEIVKALQYATEQTALAFDKIDFQWNILENYIVSAYDFIAERLIQQKILRPPQKFQKPETPIKY